MDLDYIIKISKILLNEKFENFQSCLMLLTEKPEEYEAKGLSDKYDFSPDDIDEEYVAEEFFEEFCQTENLTLIIDWSGEDDEGQLDYFISSRMNEMGVGNVDLSIVKEWDASVSLSDYAKGEYIVEKFKVLSSYIDSKYLKLVFINNGGDCYMPFIVSVSDFIDLKKIAIEDEDYYIHDIESM
ncbi:hypothetical protein BCT69_19605 [Enterovibrio norvegicus]|nr:hypothetical protein BCT69_19605 [Enterovibrio norvegicus]